MKSVCMRRVLSHGSHEQNSGKQLAGRNKNRKKSGTLPHYNGIDSAGMTSTDLFFMKLHQVKGRHVNSYIAEYADGLLVVDVAWRGEQYVLGYIVEVLKRQPTDVKLVICTHGDPDHSGGITNLAKACRAEIAIPYATHSTVNKLINDPLGIFYRFATALRESVRPRAWAMYASPKRDAHARTLPRHWPEVEHHNDEFDGVPNFRLKNRTHLPGFSDWLVLHTPGHSWDSCCFYHASSGTLISGDTLLGSSKKGVLVPPAIYSNPMQRRHTHHVLKKLDLTTVCPGHGSIIEGSNLLDHL